MKTWCGIAMVEVTLLWDKATHLLLLDRYQVRTPVSKLFEDRFCVSVSCRVSGEGGEGEGEGGGRKVMGKPGWVGKRV